MENPRRAYRLVWLALTWFALSIGAVAASAVINPQAVELICSGAHGIKIVVKGDGDTPATGHHQMGDCPVCVTAGAPPPEADISPACQARAHAPAPWVAAYVATFAAAPLLAHGHPSI